MGQLVCGRGGFMPARRLASALRRRLRFQGKPGGGPGVLLFLAGVPGVQDALVVDDEQGCGEQHERG
jgi:hypothetical protein